MKTSKGDFVVIGENVHTTRVLMLKGKLIETTADGGQAVRYTSGGTTRFLPIPDEMKTRQDYQEGRVKHVMIAMRAAMRGDQEGLLYLKSLVERQIAAGADFLDLNVDEISLKPGEQVDAMRWLVQTVESMCETPLSIDSSNLDTIRAGIEACKRTPMLNSASLERLDALDLAADRKLPVIVTAAGERGMPAGAEDRVANASRMVDAAEAKGIVRNSIYVDPLVFPIAVDSAYGQHCLDAIRMLRTKYGPDLHITGGLSNVSFGLPLRKLINEAFINLAVENGADSGIVDPVANDLPSVFASDRNSKSYQMAVDVLLGKDRNCKNFLRAYRKGEIQ